MKKFFTYLFAFASTPALLIGHALTQHPGFLYVFGLTQLLCTLLYFCGMVMYLNIMTSDDPKVRKVMTEWGTKGHLTFSISVIYSISAFCYMVYIEHFGLATWVLINTMIAMIMRAILVHEGRQMRAKLAEAVK